jgi:uncharacterized protein YjcR
MPVKEIAQKYTVAIDTIYKVLRKERWWKPDFEPSFSKGQKLIYEIENNRRDLKKGLNVKCVEFIRHSNYGGTYMVKTVKGKVLLAYGNHLSPL